MCGINGIYRSGPVNGDIAELVELMNQLVHHRGPDENGCFIEKQNEYEIAMGIQRLSIIDLENGSQPKISKSGQQVIVFNGEIYNYKILRSELEDRGAQFESDSDTEVILRLYEVHGVSGFGKLDGMFAFSIYDKEANKIFIARDYFGEKPLYYRHTDSELIWASELKSLTSAIDFKPAISRRALALYFQLTYIPAPYSIYQKVYKLSPNHVLECECDTMSITISEIKARGEVNQNIDSFNDAKLNTRALVEESVLSRSVSDVPIGTFLSGGVDSSIISLCLARNCSAPISTFSIGYEKKSFDETEKSRLVAKILGSNHHEFQLKIGDLRSDLETVLLNFDEPFADSSALPTYFISKMAREHVKVILTGDGGDEVFGGYNKYYIGKVNRIYTNLVPRSFHNRAGRYARKYLSSQHDSRGVKFRIRKALDAVSYDGSYYKNIISLGFKKSELNSLLANSGSDEAEVLGELWGGVCESLSDFRNFDRKVSLEGDMLVKVDRASMLASLECRSPFLNRKLWDFTASLPDSYLLRGWNKKFLLKEAFKDDFPKGFLDKSKTGFGVPIGDWLRGSLSKDLKYFANEENLVTQGIFNPAFVIKMVNDHINGLVDNTFKVWCFYCFQNWYYKKYLAES